VAVLFSPASLDDDTKLDACIDLQEAALARCDPEGFVT
jgi:hypothetical protein